MYYAATMLPMPMAMGEAAPTQPVSQRGRSVRSNWSRMSGEPGHEQWLNGRGCSQRKGNNAGDVGDEALQVGEMTLSGGGQSKKEEEAEREEGKYAFSKEEALRQDGRGRTTLMIRNIPNQYDQSMMLDSLDRHFRGKYDVFYLPIDYKNRCNLGYAFVNFIEPAITAEMYDHFHDQKWEKFQSRKVCEVTYARLQGKEQLLAHFRNSRFPSRLEEHLPLVLDPSTGETHVIYPSRPSHCSPNDTPM